MSEPKEADEKTPPAKQPENSDICVPFNESDPLNGIFAELNRRHNGNLQGRGVLVITASSTLANQPEQIVEPNWKSHWVSENIPDQWIKIDLKSARLMVSGYSIKTYNYVAGGNHLRSWVLEGSADDVDWVELDRQQSTSDLNGKGLVKSYEVKMTGSYRYLKLTQTGKSHCDSDMMALTAIEFFGRYRLMRLS